MNPPFQRFPLVLRIILMFFMFLFNMGVVQVLAVYAASTIFGIENIEQVLGGNFAQANAVNAFLFIQGVSSLGGFALTAMMFAVLETGEFKHRLRIDTLPSLKLILLAVLSIFVAQFFIEFLVELNKKIPTPASLQFLNEFQNRAEELTNALMNFTSVSRFIATVIGMAVIPAIAEEFFFRGLLLGALLRGEISPFIAILASGFIFAFSHMEYDNTIAIFALGSFLGYLFYISGSLWLPIIAHFTNNFFAVLMKYLFNLGVISEELAEAKTPLYATIISLLFFTVLIFSLNKWKKQPTFVEPEIPNETTLP